MAVSDQRLHAFDMQNGVATLEVSKGLLINALLLSPPFSSAVSLLDVVLLHIHAN